LRTRSFKDLIVWQKAFALTKESYAITNGFPASEIYCLSQQMRRAAVSIPSNIAEGYGRFHNKEYKQFLSVSYGSICELETQYLLSVDLGYTSRNKSIEGLIKEVGSMLYTMINPKHANSTSEVNHE
jgi:four helix bundle protein